MDELYTWLLLARVPGFHAGTLALALKHFDSIASLAAATPQSLAEIGLSAAAIATITDPPHEKIDIDRRWLERSGNTFIARSDPRYPHLLAQLSDAPIGLFVRGNVESLSLPQLAMVGSRNPTAGGRAIAESFAAHFATCGLAITSGLAVGIDAASHEGALRAGGTTLAVCATGLDSVYPKSHEALANAIVERGALISEFPLQTPPNKFQFPRRNRIISALSLGTLVVEAALKSGSLITAKYAAEQGREVFAIPGSIHSPLTRGCHQLLRQGAKLVEAADDVLVELGPLAAVGRGDGAAVSVARNTQLLSASLDKDYKMLLDALGFDPAGIDQLVERSGFKPEEVASMLLILELDGRIESLPGARYVRAGGR